LPYHSEKEQQRIADCLSSIDDLINAEEKKLETLKLHKKGLLQKMFPAEGETVPEIRFPRFTDAWEKQKLINVAEIIMGQSPSSENYTDNPDDWILVQGNADMKNGRVTPRVWTTQITKLAHKGDLILSVRAPVGDIGKTDYDVVLGRGVAAIRGNEFLYQTLVKLKNEGYWNKLSAGSTFESINSNAIKESVIMVPSEKEQHKIGTLLFNIDNLITLQQQKVECLKLHKKGLLQGLFPTIEEINK
jgi:type I restriction enzyme S subunit